MFLTLYPGLAKPNPQDQLQERSLIQRGRPSLDSGHHPGITRDSSGSDGILIPSEGCVLTVITYIRGGKYEARCAPVEQPNFCPALVDQWFLRPPKS